MHPAKPCICSLNHLVSQNPVPFQTYSQFKPVHYIIINTRPIIFALSPLINANSNKNTSQAWSLGQISTIIYLTPIGNGEKGIFSQFQLFKSTWRNRKLLRIEQFINLLFFPIIKMNSVYYKVSPTGYQRCQQTPPSNVDLTRQIPVYRVVNQFMGQREKSENPLSQNPTATFYVDISPSSASENESTSSEVRYTSRNRLVQPERDQIESTFTEESGREYKHSKEKQMSQRDLKASEVATIIKAKMHSNLSQAKLDNVTVVGHHEKQRILEFELQKERVLRKNLEKSYQNLLRTLKQRQFKLSFHEEQFLQNPKHTVPIRSKTDRVPKINHDEPQQQVTQEMRKNQLKMRKSCCNFEDIQKVTSNSQDNYDFYDQDQFREYFQAEKWFQHKLTEDIASLHARIEQIDCHLKFQEAHYAANQGKLLSLERQNDCLKMELAQRKIVEEKHTQKIEKESSLSKKEHIHYIFSILIMFLCFAMFAKNKQ